MTATRIEPIEETVEIAAPPVAVWALVTDLPRMAEWSPQVWKSFVRSGGPVRLGTRTLNVNRRGPLVWPTRSRVVRFEPHRDFAFQVQENASIWSFELEPTGTGTRVTQRREAPDGLTTVSTAVTKALLGGPESFAAELKAGMRVTLDRIRKELESA